MSFWRRRRARVHIDRGAWLIGERRLDEALTELEQAAAVAPDDWRVWYDLGLLHKWRREWAPSRDCNRAAVELGGDHDACWNLGIAATAIGDWAVARRAWRGVGIAVPDGDGPVELGLGLCVVRLRTIEGGGETVWCERVDPVRGRVANIPLVESGHRWGDVVLHDGEPAGTRGGPHGSKVTVFDELERLEPSPFVTWRATVVAPVERDVIDLVDRFREPARAAEDWTASVHPLCDACSRGEPDGEHCHGPDDDEWLAERTIAFAARERGEVVELLEAWAGDGRGRSWRRLDGGD